MMTGDLRIGTNYVQAALLNEIRIYFIISFILTIKKLLNEIITKKISEFTEYQISYKYNLNSVKFIP